MSELGPNALEPCPSESARRRHLAHGVLCSRCDPALERRALCPSCDERVTVVGDRVLPHDQEGVEGYECRGSGAAVEPLVPVERGIPRRAGRHLTLVGAA